MQKAAIDLIPYLLYLAEPERQGIWTMGWELPYPKDMPPKVRQNIIKRLIRNGYSGGCPCGCRADLVITDKGLAVVGKERTAPYNGY